MTIAFPPLPVLLTRRASRKLPVTPLSATLTVTSQTTENKTTLSSVFATLTSRVKHKFFVCHSYKKHPGWGYISCPISPASSFATLLLPPTIPSRMCTSPKRTRNSFRFRTSKTQDLKPFRIRTYEKTPGGAPSACFASTYFAFVAALRALCHNRRSCIAARIGRFPACEDFPNP